MDRPGGRLSTRAHGILLTVSGAACLGTLGPVSTLAYRTGIAAATFSALRALLGATILALLVLTGREPGTDLRRLPRSEQRMLAFAVTANAVENLALFAAFGSMTVALVMAIFYTTPAIVAVTLAVLGRERLTPFRVGALVLAGCGLALMLGSQAGPNAHASLVGVVLAAIAAVCHAAYFIAVKDGFPHVPAVQAASLVLGGGVVVSGSAAVLTLGTGIAGPWVGSAGAWAAAIVAGTVGAAFSKALVIGGIRAIGAARGSMVMLLEPVVGVALAALVVGQELTLAEGLGGLAILVAAAAVQRPDRGALPMTRPPEVDAPATAEAPPDPAPLPGSPPA